MPPASFIQPQSFSYKLLFLSLLCLLLLPACETVQIDGLSKRQFRKNPHRPQCYPPQDAPYDEPVFDYSVKWMAGKQLVEVRLKPVKAVQWPAARPEQLRLSHGEEEATCVNASIGDSRKNSNPRRLVFPIPADDPEYSNQIYHFSIQYREKGAKDYSEERLFFYDEDFYPDLVYHYRTRRAKRKRLAGSKTYKINGGVHEPMKFRHVKSK